MGKYIYLAEVTFKLKGERTWLQLKRSGICLDVEKKYIEKKENKKKQKGSSSVKIQCTFSVPLCGKNSQSLIEILKPCLERRIFLMQKSL